MREIATAKRPVSRVGVKTTLRTITGKVIDVSGEANDPKVFAAVLHHRSMQRMADPAKVRARISDDLRRRGLLHA